MSVQNNHENNMFTQAAQIEEIFRSLNRIEITLSKVTEQYMTKEEVAKEFGTIEEKLSGRIGPIEKIVYGLVAVVLTSVIGAVLALVIITP